MILNEPRRLRRLCRRERAIHRRIFVMFLVETVRGLLRGVFLGKGLKRILDLLPADGKKTYLGVLAIILGAIASGANDQSVGEFAAQALEAVQAMSPEDLSSTGIAVVIVGLVHKVLKWANESK